MQEEIILKLKSDLEFKLSNLELQNKSNKEVLNIIDQIINEHMNNNNYDLDKIRFIYPILNMEISFDEMEKYILFVSSEGVDKDIFKKLAIDVTTEDDVYGKRLYSKSLFSF